MKIHELSKELGVTNKVLIDFLKSKDYNVHSHLQTMEDQWITEAREGLASISKASADIPVETAAPLNEPIIATEPVSTKEFKPDDMIPCRSVCPWKLITVGQDKNTVYSWEYFGDVDYVSYKDLQYLRRKDVIKRPMILIEDADLVSQWRRDIGEIYKPFIGVDYPEQLLELPNDKFEDLLKNGSNTVREIIKVTAMSMIKAENYPDLNKILLIDSILGTCIKDFLG